MDYFFTHADSVSFRELKNAKKKYFFLNLGGVRAKTRFYREKKIGEEYCVWRGKILGQLALYTWVSSPVDRLNGTDCNANTRANSTEKDTS